MSDEEQMLREWQYRMDWSEAIMDNAAFDQQKWVATWIAAHTWVVNPNGGHIGIPDPTWEWPKQVSRKVYI